MLDLGLAVAGPFGTQLLADLGATVIKVNNRLFDSFWMQTSIAMCCNRGKQSIMIDLKHPEGMAVLHELVQTAPTWSSTTCATTPPRTSASTTSRSRSSTRR